MEKSNYIKNYTKGIQFVKMPRACPEVIFSKPRRGDRLADGRLMSPASGGGSPPVSHNGVLGLGCWGPLGGASLTRRIG